PDDPWLHNVHGAALCDDCGRYEEAEAAYREALRLRPDDPEAHYNLGAALSRQGRDKEAQAAYREALRLRLHYPQAHCNLGHALCEQGRFLDALEELRVGHDLGNKTPGWPYPSADWVRHCERMVELDRLLPRLLLGEAEPVRLAERIELASFCQL